MEERIEKMCLSNLNSDENLSDRFHVTLSLDEKIRCLEEIISKLKKVLYVYDKSFEKNSNYNYKVFCGGIMIYVSSSNVLFDGELVNIIVNLNAILTNNFSKNQIKRLVFETINFTQYILSKYTDIKKGKDQKVEEDIKEMNLLKENVRSFYNKHQED